MNLRKASLKSYFKKDLRAIDTLVTSGDRTYGISTTAAAYVALLFITGLATAAQPMRYAYMDTDWYKTQGVFAEQAEKQSAERKRLLDGKTIGLYVSNTTAYPANVVLKKFSRGSTYPSLTKEKAIPEGTTVEILGDALDKNYLYTLTGSVAKKTPLKPGSSFAGPGGIRMQMPTFGAIGVSRDSTPAPTATTTHYISTKKGWSIDSPASPKRELVLELSEQQAAQPILTIRNK